jgi:hypothetical protein
MEWKIRLAAAIATAPFRDDHFGTNGFVCQRCNGSVSVVKMVGDISVSDVLTQERRPIAALSRFKQQLRRGASHPLVFHDARQ